LPAPLTRFAAALAVCALLAGACGSRLAPTGAGPSPTAATAPPTSSPAATTAAAPPGSEASLRVRATEAVVAFRDKDFAKLAALAHPDKGVGFTPYTFVQPRDVVLDAATIRQGFANTRTYLWGFSDGKGDALEWTFERYHGRYVYERDYAAAPQVLVDNYPQVRGNKYDNTKAVFPSARTVEYFFPETGPGPNWSGLRLVFEDRGGSWYLVGVIHDEWTI